MATTVFPVSAIFCRKMTEKVNLSVTTVQYQKKGKSWRWKDILTSFESRLMCKGGFCHANFSSLTNVFVSITVFQLSHAIRVSFTFFGITKTFVTLETFAWQKHSLNPWAFACFQNLAKCPPSYFPFFWKWTVFMDRLAFCVIFLQKRAITGKMTVFPILNGT